MSLPSHKNRGFTLIEMLVSVALFSIVMVMALGALLALSVADRRAQALKASMDNLTFAVDSMARNIRTGSMYNCGTGAPTVQNDCTNGSQLSFITANGTALYYRATNSSSDATVCGQPSTAVGCILRSTDGVTWSSITSPDITLTDTDKFFLVTGAAANKQPAVFIRASGTVKINENQINTFRMHTTATQRIYDL